MPDSGRLIPAIVLGAGLSRRMGQNKLLLEIQGRPIVHWVIDALLSSNLEEIIVVTGHQADRLMRSCSHYEGHVRFVHNAEFRAGRASSIHAGLDALPASCTGVLITPGDVPFITPALVNQLHSSFVQTNRITFPVVNGAKGHPVLFPALAFQLLRGLSGEQTLNDYLLSHPEQTCQVAVDDARCITDFDNAQDVLDLTS